MLCDWLVNNTYIALPFGGSLAEITNQRLALKYHMFRQLAAAFISGGLPKRLVFQRISLVGDFRKRTLSDATQPDKLLQHHFARPSPLPEAVGGAHRQGPPPRWVGPG